MLFKSQVKNPIYTRSGDLGMTILSNGQKVSKASSIVTFLGELELISANLGLCIAFIRDAKESILDGSRKLDPEIEIIQDIQKDIQIIKHLTLGDTIDIDLKKEISNLEVTIDDYGKLIKNYDDEILFGGSTAASQMYITYANSHGVERIIVSAKSESLIKILPYFNRLSTLLFLIARHINIVLNDPEIKIRVK